MKKKKPEVETEMRALLPQEVEECAQKLAGLFRSKKTIKRQAKEAARTFKTRLEEIEEEEERLAQAIITQQEEVPVQRQMTLAEIEDKRRHEESLAEFERETNAFNLHDEPPAPQSSTTSAESSDAAGGKAQDLASMTFDELVELESELDRKQSREKDEAAFDRMNQVRDELNRRVEPDEADAPAVHGSARDLARFKASLSERTDSELFKLQIQCGKEGSDNSYYEAVLDERLRREDSSAEVSPDEAIAATVVVLATPDRNTIEGGLYAALHHFSDASERWQYLRETGATDAQLKKAISYELGHGGGQSGPGLKPISFKGDKEPAFWFDSQPPARPTLKGKPLIDKARMVLAIPIPVAAWTPANGKATQTDPLDLVPGDFHHRNWSSLSDTELSAWRTRLHGKRSGEVIRNEHGEAKLLGWMQRADAVWDARDAEWSKSDAAGGAK